MSRSSSSPFFFFSTQLFQGQEVDIVGDEASHILRSRRIGEGERITLTDGLGHLATARITVTTPKRNQLTAVVESTTTSKAIQVEKALASALPKGDRLSVMLDMATQLGMNAFIPLRCEHSSTKFQPKMTHRWHRIIRESSKQCRQGRFPNIQSEMDLFHLLKDKSIDTLLIYADHQGVSKGDLQWGDWRQYKKIIMLVGPEGGFSKQEIDALQRSDAIPIKLGDLILRTESAAVSLVSTVNQLVS